MNFSSDCMPNNTYMFYVFLFLGLASIISFIQNCIAMSITLHTYTNTICRYVYNINFYSQSVLYQIFSFLFFHLKRNEIHKWDNMKCQPVNFFIILCRYFHCNGIYLNLCYCFFLCCLLFSNNQLGEQQQNRVQLIEKVKNANIWKCLMEPILSQSTDQTASHLI